MDVSESLARIVCCPATEARSPARSTRTAAHYQYDKGPDALKALAFYDGIENVPNRRGRIMNLMPLLYLQNRERFEVVAEDEEFDGFMISDFKQRAESLRAAHE